MRDVSPGRDLNVHGDLNIHDESTRQYKLLVHCSNDELIAEEKHRREVLNGERSDKRVNLFRLIGLAAGVLLVAVVYFYTQGNMNFVTFALGAGSFVTSLAAFKGYSTPNDFELRQLAALSEIHCLLRERRAR
jgi:hypothetical protein